MIGTTINAFASSTKHKNFEIGEVDKDEHLIKKLLATQSPHWKEVYKLVSNDITRINHKAPGILQRYSDAPENLTMDFFVDLLKDQEYDETLLKPFINAVHPPKGYELPLYFANKTYECPDFIESLSSMCNDDLDTKSKLYRGLVNYNFDEEDSTDVASMINDFNFKKIAATFYIECQPVEEKVKFSAKQVTNSNIKMVFAGSHPKEVSLDTERQFRANDNVREYKKKNLLPTQYSSIKVANRIIIDSRYDTPKDILDVVNYYSKDLVNSVLKTEQAYKYYCEESLKNPQSKLTKQEFIINMFTNAVLSDNVASEIKAVIL